jgi:hypothetical protein
VKSPVYKYINLQDSSDDSSDMNISDNSDIN